MAEFFSTEGISLHLRNIIRDAKKRLVIISPYLSANPRIRDEIKRKSEDGSVEVHLIYRHREQKPDVEEWLQSMPHVKISFCESLHAKCYFNEREALLTSMNLYEYSQVSNYEMGILVSSREYGDSDLYKAIIAESARIIGASTTVREAAPVPETASKGFSLSSALSGFFGSKPEAPQDPEDTAVETGTPYTAARINFTQHLPRYRNSQSSV